MYTTNIILHYVCTVLDGMADGAVITFCFLTIRKLLKAVRYLRSIDNSLRDLVGTMDMIDSALNTIRKDVDIIATPVRAEAQRIKADKAKKAGEAWSMFLKGLFSKLKR